MPDKKDTRAVQSLAEMPKAAPPRPTSSAEPRLQLDPASSLAIIENAQDAGIHNWPEIEGIDTQGARSRWCNDLKLFRSMLERCLDEFADIGLPSSRSVPPGLKGKAARLHKLRGGACMLGANAIGILAAEAEAACMAGDEVRAAHLAIGLAAHVEALSAAAAHAFLKISASNC